MEFVGETEGEKQLQVLANTEKGITVDGAGVAVNAGDGLTFDTTTDKVGQLKVNTGAGLSIDSENENAVKVNVGNGLTIDDSNNVAVKLYDPNNTGNLVVDTNGLSLSDALTGLTSVESNTVIVGRDLTDPENPEMGVTINGKKITGLDTNSITSDEDAVNKAYVDKFFNTDKGLAVQYDDADKTTVTLDNSAGVEIKNVKTAAWASGSTSAANVALVYSKTGSVSWTTTNYLNGLADLTTAATTLDSKIGGLTFTGTYRLNDTENTVTDALNKLDSGVGTVDFTFLQTPYLSGDYNLTSATDKLARIIQSISANVGIDITGSAGSIDWGDDVTYIGGAKSIVEGMGTLDQTIKGIDDRVTTLEGLHPELNSNSIQTFSAMSTPQISTLSTLSNMDMSTANMLTSITPDALSNISTLSAEDAPVSNAEPAANDSPRHPGYDQELKGDHIIDGKLAVTDDATFDKNVSVGGSLDVKGEANFHSNATFDKDVSIGGTLNMNGNKITGVAAGEISADSTDAVNGSQLHDAWQQINNNTENIGILGSAVNKLGDRIERVGAGAAALAALHPLDFDPDNKLDFAAGFGNYRGASAVAVGAFYRPSENVMFSVGGAFGGGEDMVNAGVSFKVGAGSGSATTSRTAMAKSLKSMQEVVASQDAQLAQQREQIDKLTAMVELLMEQNGQAQPKDGDAQAAQPQQ
ncbi:YadA-like family protein [Megasphaera hexanoica]|nr:YadA-like family protein [Megasphaera hexanoica]